MRRFAMILAFATPLLAAGECWADYHLSIKAPGGVKVNEAFTISGNGGWDVGDTALDDVLVIITKIDEPNAGASTYPEVIDDPDPDNRVVRYRTRAHTLASPGVYRITVKFYWLTAEMDSIEKTMSVTPPDEPPPPGGP